MGYYRTMYPGAAKYLAYTSLLSDTWPQSLDTRIGLLYTPLYVGDEHTLETEDIKMGLSYDCAFAAR